MCILQNKCETISNHLKHILFFFFFSGYVLSIMGRRRNLPDINSPDWGVRMQSERQAVNFVVQGKIIYTNNAGQSCHD